jgi:hypothetical protein
LTFGQKYANSPKKKLYSVCPAMAGNSANQSEAKLSSLVDKNKELAFLDNTGKTYYNSIPTIIEKPNLPKNGVEE